MIAYAPQNGCAFFIADGGLIRCSRSVRIPLCPTAMTKRHSQPAAVTSFPARSFSSLPTLCLPSLPAPTGNPPDARSPPGVTF